MKYHEITEKIVLANTEYGSNIACIALDDELYFIDTSMHTETAKIFRKEMEEKYDLKSTNLILTHAHIDHIFGMGAFKDLRMISAEAGIPRLERFNKTEYTEEIIANVSRVFPFFRESVSDAELFMPKITVNTSDYFGPEKEIYFEVIGGHSACSSFIHVPSEKVLFVGDLVQYNAYPYFGEPNTDINKWISALEKWEQEDIEYYLPGHGLPFDKGYLREVKTYFEDLVAVLKNLKEQNIPEDDIPYHPLMPKGYWNDEAIRKPPFDFSVKNLYKKL